MNQDIPTYKYDVFISYLRKNELFAAKLEQALESYRPEKSLGLPQRYIDTFRDKEDFSSGNYHKNLLKNLEESSKLIVICSPEARASKFVNEEVRLFAGIRGAEHIIPVLLSGIPNNEAKDGQENEMAFPEELRIAQEMPIAIDYRNFNMRWHRVNRGAFTVSWNWLLADIYNISRGEIEQRERKRSARYWRNAFAATGVILAVVFLLLVFALVSRSEAVAARNQAEILLARALKAEAAATDALEKERAANSLAEERRVLAENSAASEKEAKNTAVQKQKEAEESAEKERAAKEQAEERRQQAEQATRNEIIAKDQAEKRRGEAEQATKNEAIAKDQAEERREEAEAQTRASYIENGRQELMNDRPFRAAVYLSEASRIPGADQNNNDVSNLRFLLGASMRSVDSLIHSYEHEGPVTTARFSPTEKKILTVAYDYSASQEVLRILEAETGKVEVIIKTGDRMAAACFSSDGQKLFTASHRGEIRIRDVKDGKILNTIYHPAGIKSAELSNDSAKIVIAGMEGVVIFDAITGGIINEFGDLSTADSVKFSRDGRKIVTAGGLRVEVREIYMRKPLASLRHSFFSFFAEFSPDDKTIITGGGEGIARLWNIETKEPEELLGRQGPVYWAGFSRDGEKIFFQNRDNGFVWTVGAKRWLALETGSYILKAGFSPDGRKLATSSGDNTVRVWDCETGAILSSFDSRGPVFDFSFSADGENIVTGGDDGTVKVWDLKKEKILSSFIHESLVTVVKFSPDGSKILTISQSSKPSSDSLSASQDLSYRVMIWDEKTTKILFSYTYPYDLNSCEFSPDGRSIAVAGKDKKVRILDIAARQEFQTFLYDGEVDFVTFSPDGRQVAAAGTDMPVKIWNVETGDIAGFFPHLRGADFAAFSHDGGKIVSLDKEAIKIFDVRTGNILFATENRGGMKVHSVKFAPDDKKLVIVSQWILYGGLVEMLDLETAQRAIFMEVQSEISSAEFSPNGKWMVTASDNDPIKIWDMETGKAVAVLRNPASEAKFSPDGNKIIFADYSKTAKIWDISSEVRSPEEINSIVEKKVPFHLSNGKLIER